MFLTPHHTQVQQIISGVGQGGKFTYILIGEQTPGRFLGGVITGTKVHSINFSEWCWNHFFAGHAWLCYSFICFIPPCGYFLRIPLPIGCWWHHYSIIPLPTEAPAISDKSSNQKLSHIDTTSHMCTNIRRDTPRFILHPTFREETSTAQNTPSTPCTSYFCVIHVTIENYHASKEWN